MKITSIKIEKLFEIFDYDISFSNDPNLLILTGPNGFGKTMILNIIYSLFNRDFLFFESLVFENIIIVLDDGIMIAVSTELILEQSFAKFAFFRNGIEIGKLSSKEFDKKFRSSSIRRPLGEASKFINNYTKKSYATDDIIYEDINLISQTITDNLLGAKPTEISIILTSLNVHLIKEQRLYKQVSIAQDPYGNHDTPILIETIQAYAIALTQLISQNIIDSFKLSQELDGSYPTRLISEKGSITKSEYDLRFNQLKHKQHRLAKNGLYENKQEAIDYNEVDSKALLVYLKDIETKLSIFDKLLEKLELFTNILNERRFTFKTIHIDKEKGFYFINSKGTELSLINLSSGEQHEVVLFYELIFNTKENTLVLIDEPELSLHVTWQKEFISDLLKIIELQKMQVIVATHAPAIINGRWDLVYSLEKVEA